MSTKTTIKRIALVAAVAAAFGGLSTVAANADTYMAGYPTITAATFSVTQGSGGTSTGATTSSPGTTVSTAGKQVVNGIATVTFYETGTAGALTDNEIYANVTSSGVGSIVSVGTGYTANSGHVPAPTAETAGSTTSAVTYPTTSLTIAADAQTRDSTEISLPINVSSATAGTQTLTAVTLGTNGTPTGTYTATITWGSAASLSASQSYSVLNAAGNDVATQGTSDASISVSKSLATAAGEVVVTVNDANGSALNGVALSAVVSGSGLIDANTGTTTSLSGSYGRVASLSAGTQAATNTASFGIEADGTSGTGTITISGTDPITGTTIVLATKTVTFVGSSASVSATQNLSVLKAGGVAASTATAGDIYSGAADIGQATLVDNTTPITALVKDSNGKGVADSSIKVVSSNSAVLVAGSCTTSTFSASETAVTGEYNCYVLGAYGAASGQTATATIEVKDSSGNYTILSAPLTFTIGGAISKEVLSFDQASYSPGQPLVLSVAATDSAGNAPYDQDATLIGSMVESTYMPALTVPASLVGGKATYKGYAPSIEGDFTISGTDASAAANAISVTDTVAGSGSTTAANNATDAANQATDAANNAIDAANAAADTAQTAADAAQSAADTATQALAAAQDADQNASDALDAAQEATDAGNAATDAANAAADSADAATAAAQDASDKAAAALAAVTQLSAQFTTLAAQVAKVLSVVQAIAKKK